MKRKILLCILSTAMALCACGLLACGGEEPIHVHEYEWTITAEANCTTNGERVGVCSCGETKTEVIPASHSYNDGVVTVEPDCTTKGEKFFTCTVCGDTYTQEISAKGHTPANAVKENVIEASCIDDGSYDSVIYCNVCYEELSRETKVIPAKGHTEVIDLAVEPTCTESGLTDGKHCSVCEEILVVQEVINATGHKFENGICTRCKEEELISTDGLKFTSNDLMTEYFVTGYEGTETEIVISGKHDGLPVTQISDGAFWGKAEITKVVIGSGIKRIGENAFWGCTGLSDITIPETVRSVGENAFYMTPLITTINGAKYVDRWLVEIESVTSLTVRYGTYGIAEKAGYGRRDLKEITIPTSLKVIGDIAFGEGYSRAAELQKIYYNGTASEWAQIDGLKNLMLCNYETKTLYLGNVAITKVELDGITEIKPYAFATCEGITKVNISNTVKTIGENAFTMCTGLTEIIIPDSVETVERLAFNGCTKIITVVLGSGIAEIEYGAFYCTKLTSVLYNGSAEDWKNVSVDNEESSNSFLLNATQFYYSETKPVTGGCFWHYVNGVPTKW